MRIGLLAGGVCAAALAPSIALAGEQGAGQTSTTVAAHAFADWTSAERESGLESEDRELRLIRFDWQHRADWGAAVVEVDVAAEEFTITDAFVDLKLGDDLVLRLGQMKEPNGLEQISSVYGKTFVRSAGVISTNGLDRRLGVSLRSYQDEWTLEAGAYASNINEDDSSDGWALAGRASWDRELGESHDRFLHFAGSVRHRESENARFAYSEDAYSFAFGKSIKTSAIGDSDLFLGAEGALVLGGFSVVGEASRTAVDCPSCASDPDFNAAYVDLSYVIGGHRAFDAHGGKFGRYQIAEPLGQGGWGAVEFAVRFDHADLTDAGIVGGRQDSSVVGITYHANENARLQLNYAHSDIEAYTTGLSNDADAVTLRLQLDFSRRH